MPNQLATKKEIQFHLKTNEMERPSIFITGGTGYIGSRLIKKILSGNYHVIALVRKGSEHKIPEGAEVIVGNPFDAKNFCRICSG